MSWLAYHPERVDDLWRHVCGAVDDLAAIDSDDPAAADAMRSVRIAQSHLQSEWLPLLERIRASTAMTAPIDGRSWFADAVGCLFGPRDARGVIAPVVAGFSDAEREFFQGFINECAASVAAELSHYDNHLDYRVDVFPEQLRQLDDRNEWDWLARLYLIEQYHHMIDSGAVELQRDGEHYWIDPLDLSDTNGIVMGEIILAGVAAAGRFSKSSSGGLSTAGARTVNAPMPAARPVVAPTSITGYTRHGLERVMNKDGVGVSPSALRDAVRNPIRVVYQEDRQTFQFVGTNATVVLNANGLVVTAFATSRAGWRGQR